MNEKFFNLKKEKQDRLLNAAMVVFGENGYKRASTDEIVAKAGVSKGLLFHYFENKLGVYAFLHDYSVKLCCLELASLREGEKKDYFEALREREKAFLGLLKAYPGIRLFLARAKRETDPQAREACRESMESYRLLEADIRERMDYSRFVPGADPEKISAILEYTNEALAAEATPEAEAGTAMLRDKLSGYLDMLEGLCCR